MTLPSEPEAGVPTTISWWARPHVRAVIELLVLSLGGGLLVGLAWSGMAPRVRSWSDSQEARIAGDGLLAGLGLASGVLLAGWALLTAGRGPLRQGLVALVGALALGPIAWGVGGLSGAPKVQAVGVVFVAPVATAVVLFLGTLIPLPVWGRFRMIPAAVPVPGSYPSPPSVPWPGASWGAPVPPDAGQPPAGWGGSAPGQPASGQGGDPGQPPAGWGGSAPA